MSQALDFIRINKKMAVVLLMIIGFSGCSDPLPPSHNPVQPLDIHEIKTLISSETFSGLAVAMASWCPPCREELPILDELFKQNKDRDIQIIAISLDDSQKAAQSLIDELKISFPVYWVGKKAVTGLKIIGVPTLLVVKKGQVIEKITGQSNRSQLKAMIRDVLASESQ